MNKKDLAVLKRMKPRKDVYLLAEKRNDFRDVWESCHRPDWMLWLLKKIDFQDDKKLRLFACRCVRETPLSDGRKVLDLLTDERSRNVVEVAEKFAEGQATKEELSIAYDYAVYAVYDYASAYASDYASASSYVAYASAYSSAYVSACSSAYDYDYAVYARKAQADILRSFISWDDVEPFYNRYAEAGGEGRNE